MWHGVYECRRKRRVTLFWRHSLIREKPGQPKPRSLRKLSNCRTLPPQVSPSTGSGDHSQVVDAAERPIAEFQDDHRLAIANAHSRRLVDHDCACTTVGAICEIPQQAHEMTSLAYDAPAADRGVLGPRQMPSRKWSGVPADA